jgi:hypothetical protein
MCEDFGDLWPESGTSAGQGKKKKARIAWPLMIATHSWMDKAVYVYHLERGEMRVVRKPTPEQWRRYTSAGTEIPYPTRIRADDLTARLRYGREQAKRLGIPAKGDR